MKQGDKNTKYFHRIATAHKRFNSIDKLTVEDLKVTLSVNQQKSRRPSRISIKIFTKNQRNGDQNYSSIILHV